MTKTKNYKSKQIENPKKIFKSQLYQKLKIKSRLGGRVFMITKSKDR